MPERRGHLSYPLAFLGSHLSFIPLFALLLPRRVAAVDPDNAVRLLSVLLLVGGLTASVAHIAAGRWSDEWLKRHGSRRGLILIGLTLLVLAQIGIGIAHTAWTLLLAIIGFQLCLNVMFAPLGALLSDYVPDERKGRVAGMLNASLPLASLGTGLAAFLFPRDDAGAFLLVSFLIAVTVLPLLVRWPFAGVIPAPDQPQENSDLRAGAIADYVRVWTARLLIQLGAAFVINYFYLYLAGRTAASEATEQMGVLAIAATLASLGSAILAGRWSDASERRRPPMLAAALACAVGLAALAFQPPWTATIAAFVLFHVGLAAFLSVDSAMVTQLIARSDRRGELLGWMNLTNTLPAIIVAILALSASGPHTRLDWSAAFSIAALLSIGGFALVARIRTIR